MNERDFCDAVFKNFRKMDQGVEYLVKKEFWTRYVKEMEKVGVHTADRNRYRLRRQGDQLLIEDTGRPSRSFRRSGNSGKSVLKFGDYKESRGGLPAMCFFTLDLFVLAFDALVKAPKGKK